MARHKKNYTGEHLTAFLGFYLAPTVFERLKAIAVNKNTTISDLARAFVSHCLGTPPPVSAMRRGTDEAALMHLLVQVMNALKANGNLVNQIAAHLHTTEELGPFAADLRDTLSRIDRAVEKIMGCIEQLIAA
jgi:hypothetical protein